jgi:hypothetical protein
MTPPTNPQDATLDLLANSHIVSVFLDPRHPDAIVPAQFKDQEVLILEIGLNLPRPIHDLRVDLAGITCTLSFGGCPYLCSVPWGAIFGVVSKELNKAYSFRSLPDAGIAPPPPPAADNVVDLMSRRKSGDRTKTIQRLGALKK